MVLITNDPAAITFLSVAFHDTARERARQIAVCSPSGRGVDVWTNRGMVCAQLTATSFVTCEL